MHAKQPDTRLKKKKSIRLLRAFNIGRTPLCLAAHLAGLCLSLECIPKQETCGSLLKMKICVEKHT